MLRHAGKGIARAGAGALTGIEQGQPQRTVVIEQRPQVIAADGSGAAFVIFQIKHPLTGESIDAAVTNKVKDVIVALAQLALQCGQGGVGQTG